MAKILLVDDDEAITSVFEITFKKEGFEIVISHTGADGLEKVKTEKPDVILLDQILPDMTGNDILKKLKEDSQTQAIPVAILSNFGQNELIQQAMNIGASDYILKYQIEPEDLINKVKGLLKEKESQPTLISK